MEMSKAEAAAQVRLGYCNSQIREVVYALCHSWEARRESDLKRAEKLARIERIDMLQEFLHSQGHHPFIEKTEAAKQHAMQKGML